MEPIARMDGDSLPVSAFKDCADGEFELGASAYEKRGVAVMVPHWDETKCIQCNQCAYVCPHATIRPFGMTEDEVAAGPETMRTLDVKIPKNTGLKFAIAISPLDCMGCTNCAKVCPKDALTMVPAEGELVEQKTFDYCVANVTEKPELINKNLKGTQFKQPLLEFSGSCAGCAETAYARLVTQVCGDRMFISNATGCSSIWATRRYLAVLHQQGRPGPAWNNSLFEDNAEHHLGMELGYKAVQGKLVAETEELMASDCATDELKGHATQAWLDARNDARPPRLPLPPTSSSSRPAAATRPRLSCPTRRTSPRVLLDLRRRQLGLRHRLRRSRPRPRFRQRRERLRLRHRGLLQHRWPGHQGFQPRSGRPVRRLRQGHQEEEPRQIAMSYGYVYVAQVAMGANPAQTLKAIQEAEAYDGPSLIIGYSPCEMHSIKKGGMQNCQAEMKKAVECGYWNMFRFNPAAEEGKKFSLDSKEPAGGYQEFLMHPATPRSPARSPSAPRSSSLPTRLPMERYQHLLKLKTLYNEA